MNRQFHNIRQSLTVTGTQAAVGRLFDSSKKTYWSHVQYKIRGKVIQNELESSTAKTFRLETLAVIEVFKSIGNSFLETEISLIHITTLHMHVSNSVRIAEQIWREQYKIFVENRLHSASASVHDNTKKKKLLLFIQKNSLVSSKSKPQLVSIKSDRQKYGSLYIVSQSKKAFFDLSRFFAHENHLYPISISKNGQLE